LGCQWKAIEVTARMQRTRRRGEEARKGEDRIRSVRNKDNQKGKSKEDMEVVELLRD
jgi:hypothetical protein